MMNIPHKWYQNTPPQLHNLARSFSQFPISLSSNLIYNENCLNHPKMSEGVLTLKARDDWWISHSVNTFPNSSKLSFLLQWVNIFHSSIDLFCEQISPTCTYKITSRRGNSSRKKPFIMKLDSLNMGYLFQSTFSRFLGEYIIAGNIHRKICMGYSNARFLWRYQICSILFHGKIENNLLLMSTLTPNHWN